MKNSFQALTITSLFFSSLGFSILAIAETEIIEIEITESYSDYARAPSSDEDSRIELQALAGISWLSVDGGSFSTLGVTNSETDTLHETSTNTPFQGGLGIHYVFSRVDCRGGCEQSYWFPEAKLGLVGYGFSGTAEGTVWQYEESNADNYKYDLTIDSWRLMVEGTVDIVAWKQYSLFVLGGLGQSWNWLEYSEDPINLGTSAGTVDIDRHMDSSFAYEIGTGIGYSLNEDFSFSLQYLFTDLGNLSTGDEGTGRFSNMVITPAEFDTTVQTIFLGIEWRI